LLEKSPAAKLLEFFEGLGSLGEQNLLDTTHTAGWSRKLRDISGIKDEWIEKWVGEWMEPVS
jgi:hypothetical protein